MTYLPEKGKVIYGDLNGERKIYDALDFLALFASHISGRYQHQVIYYGFCLPPQGGQASQGESG